MKSTIKLNNIKCIKDINKIRKAVASNEGVMACQINQDNGEINVIFDDYFIKLEEIIGSIEELGYTVI